MKSEYAANIFTILMMPQIMEGSSWNQLSPYDLNNAIYQKLINSIDEKLILF